MKAPLQLRALLLSAMLLIMFVGVWHAATPKAVLIMVGQIEQMKITKIDDSAESLIG